MIKLTRAGPRWFAACGDYGKGIEMSEDRKMLLTDEEIVINYASVDWDSIREVRNFYESDRERLLARIAELEAEKATLRWVAENLRGQLVELEAMLPRWVKNISAEADAMFAGSWHVAASDARYGMVLMVPPLPPPKEGG